MGRLLWRQTPFSHLPVQLTCKCYYSWLLFSCFLLIEHINDLHYIVVTRWGSIWIVMTSKACLCFFKEALQQYRCYLTKSHFDGKPINEFPVKSPMLNLEDIEWKNLVMHWSRSQDKVLSMKSHDNLNFYFSACALRIFFAGIQLEEEFRLEKNDGISQICCPLLCSC